MTWFERATCEVVMRKTSDLLCDHTLMCLARPGTGTSGHIGLFQQKTCLHCPVLQLVAAGCRPSCGRRRHASFRVRKSWRSTEGPILRDTFRLHTGIERSAGGSGKKEEKRKAKEAEKKAVEHLVDFVAVSCSIGQLSNPVVSIRPTSVTASQAGVV